MRILFTKELVLDNVTNDELPDLVARLKGYSVWHSVEIREDVPYVRIGVQKTTLGEADMEILLNDLMFAVRSELKTIYAGDMLFYVSI